MVLNRGKVAQKNGNMKKEKMCKIPYMHDFKDYPCKKCSPKRWWYVKIIDEATKWLLVAGVAFLLAYCVLSLF